MNSKQDMVELESEEAMLLPDRVALSYCCYDPCYYHDPCCYYGGGGNVADVAASNSATAINALSLGSVATATANQGIFVGQS